MKRLLKIESPKKLFANIFIIFHIFFLGLWISPPFLLRNILVQHVSPYILWLGLWQNWDMFAPSTYNTNSMLLADIKFQDGTHTTWEFPRPAQSHQYQKGRYGQWRDFIRMDGYSLAWPDTTRFIARLHKNPQSPPSVISLIRYWEPIPPPTQDFHQPLNKKVTYSRHETFFTYQVTPEDLL